ncbi:MAG TPA: PAS domain-containing sensor histidine kinase, partial [Isosphaeraceae bacterium]|nr:PAS domain-containing sensor histidine kinase [Isosphaeraceae bacterium]
TERKRAEEAVKESEAKYRALTEALPNLVWTCLSSGNCDWLSSQWGEYTGIPESELLGLRWLELTIHPDDRDRTLTCWNAACTDQGDYDLEYRIRRFDGEYHWFKTRGVPIRDEQGKILYWIGTCTDIEDVKRLEEALRDADRRKDEFLATLAHELRNPLAPIRNVLHLMKHEVPGAREVEHDRAMAERQVTHLARLIDDLMDVARISRGKIDLRVETVDLATIMLQAVETARPQIDKRRHNLAVSLPQKPIALEADPTRLEQILWNLLNNAAKYTEPGGAIVLKAWLDGDQVVVSVRDSGLGIPSKTLPHIFEMFVQAEYRTDRAQGGLGIGLGLVNTLVQMHGGTIEARSDGPGTGSEFLVRLPALPTTPASGMIVSREQPAETGGTLTRLRILVVDDNRDAAESLA